MKVAVVACVGLLVAVVSASQDGLCASFRKSGCGGGGWGTFPDGYVVSAEPAAGLARAGGATVWGASALGAGATFTCADDYFGTAKSVACTADGGAYSFTGCTACTAIVNAKAGITCTDATDSQAAAGCEAGYYKTDAAADTCTACPTATDAAAACPGAAGECKNKGYSDDTTAAPGCNKCGANCNKCPAAAATCTECVPGYWENGGTCQVCATITKAKAGITCTDATDSQAAAGCEDGYWKDTGAAADVCTACTGTMAGCAKCSDGNTCTECAAGKYRDQTPTPDTCTDCTSANAATSCTATTNYFVAANCGLTAATDTHTATDTDSKGCTAKTSCVGKNTATTKYYEKTDSTTTADAVCGTCVAGCSSCTASDACPTGNCMDGYYEVAGTKITCAACAAVANSATNGVRCNKAGAAGIIATTTCATGFGQTGTAGTDLSCAACPANCAACTTKVAECTTCNSGFGLKTADKTCVACTIANCGSCDGATPGTCTACKTGFSFVGGVQTACKQCPSGCNVCTADAAKCVSGNCMAGHYETKALLCPACTTGGAHGAVANEGGCTKCAANYYQDAGKKTDCDATCKACAGGGIIKAANTGAAATKCEGSASSIAALASLVVALSSMMF